MITVTLYLCLAVLMYGLWLLLKLHWITALALFAILAGTMFLHRRRYREQKKRESIFYDACRYLETVLYAFSKEGKIETALGDTYETVNEGKLKENIKNALNHIKLTFDETEVMSDALRIMEEEYPCKRVRSVHEFMLHVESYGGDTSRQISLLLEDKKRWQLRVEKTMAERRKSLREVILSVATSLIICGIILYLPVMNMDIRQSLVGQLTAAALILADDFIIYAAQKFLIADWLNLDAFSEGKRQTERLEAFRSYDEKKSRKASFISGGAAGLISLALLILGHDWLSLIGFGITLVLLNQHKIGHSLMRKDLMKEIKAAFPNWLLDMVLLLQSENVQVAIAKSKEQAPEILSDDLRRLESRLAVSPEASEPYYEFLKEFQVPEIGSAMSMLYSLSMGQAQSGQLEGLIAGNYELLDEAEQHRLKDKSSGMYLLFLAPVMTASIKLVVDMALFMLTFIGTGLSI